jgi:uncharacterized membrane protein
VIPFYVMIVGIAAARIVGAIGWRPLDDWQAATRVGLAIMLVFTGVAHFTATRADLIRMVPPQLPNPALLVTVTGIAELAGAVGLVVPALAPWAAYLPMLLLVAMFPANLNGAKTGHRVAGRPHTRLAVRLPLQLLWIALFGWSVS